MLKPGRASVDGWPSAESSALIGRSILRALIFCSSSGSMSRLTSSVGIARWSALIPCGVTRVAARLRVLSHFSDWKLFQTPVGDVRGLEVQLLEAGHPANQLEPLVGDAIARNREAPEPGQSLERHQAGVGQATIRRARQDRREGLTLAIVIQSREIELSELNQAGQRLERPSDMWHSARLNDSRFRRLKRAGTAGSRDCDPQI